MSTKTNFTKYQKGMMLALPLAIILNPMTVQIFLNYILTVFTVVSVAATVYIVVFMLIKALKPEKVIIPKGKTKKQAYIET